MDRIHRILLACFLLLPLAAIAQEPFLSSKTIYLTANAGIFQGTFNAKYLDQSDVIVQNIAETIQQKGYTGGIGIGYSKIFLNSYLLGFEVSGGGMNQNATYQSGSATSAYSDKFAMESYVDLVFVPGIFLTPSLASYLKVGVSRGSFSDALNTPVGYNPTMVSSNSTQHATGFTGSIGLKKWVTPVLSLFAEYNYRDYGTVSFPGFVNFQTNYSHSARIIGQSVLLGIDFQIV